MSQLKAFALVLTATLLIGLGVWYNNSNYTINLNNGWPTISIKHDVPVDRIYALALEVQSVVNRCDYKMDTDQMGHTSPECVKFMNASERMRQEVLKHFGKYGQDGIEKIFLQELTPSQVLRFNSILGSVTDVDSRINVRFSN